MTEFLRKYLLSSVAFAPETGDGTPNEPEVDPDDDELSLDPANEPEPDEETDPELEPEDPEIEHLAAEPAKGDRGIAALRAERRRLAEDNARITRELDDLRRNPPRAQAPVETVQQRADRLAMLSPEDRIRTEVNEALQANEYKQNLLHQQLLDQSDRSAFAAMAASNPLAKKLESEVERRHADLKSQGRSVERSILFTYLVGERVLAQQGKPNKAAAANRARNQARPSGSRGDVRPADRRGGPLDQMSAAEMEKRFGDIPI